MPCPSIDVYIESAFRSLREARRKSIFVLHIIVEFHYHLPSWVDQDYYLV